MCVETLAKQARVTLGDSDPYRLLTYRSTFQSNGIERETDTRQEVCQTKVRPGAPLGLTQRQTSQCAGTSDLPGS